MPAGTADFFAQWRFRKLRKHEMFIKFIVKLIFHGGQNKLDPYKYQLYEKLIKPFMFSSET